MTSILTTVKKMLGLDSDYEVFDVDIIIGINTAFMVLTQIGVGPPQGFSISSKDETWEDFTNGRLDLEAVKTFVYLKTKLVFDPPTNSFAIDAMNRQLDEIEWRLNINSERRISKSCYSTRMNYTIMDD